MLSLPVPSGHSPVNSMKKLTLTLISGAVLLGVGSGVAVAQGVNPYAGTGLSYSNDMAYGAQPARGHPGFYLPGSRDIQFRLGTDIYQERYSEVDTSGNKVMDETAIMYGITAGVDIPLSQYATLKIDGMYATGKSSYTGSYMGQPYGSLSFSGLDRNMFKVSGVTTYRFTDLADTELGLGLEYRQLTDRLDQAGPGGYKRVNKSLWAVVTAEKTFATGSDWTLTPDARFRYLLSGTQEADILGGLNFQQKNGMGFELGLAATYRFNSVDITLKPYYRHTTIQASKTTLGFYEPKNTTQEYGLQLYMTF